MWILIVPVTLLLLIIVYLLIPFSPMKSNFEKTALSLISESETPTQFFTESEIEKLPEPVKKYFITCGFIGTKKMSYMKGYFKNTNFLLSPNKYIKNNYTEYIFVNKPVKIAISEINMYGIPIQAVESNVNGKGMMKGKIAKTFTLFNETGFEMDVSCLVTVLSYCLIVPNMALQDYIVWENIDDTRAKATISYYGISASGIFTFNKKGEMASFTTNDRWEAHENGTKIQTPWSVILSNYEKKEGIMQPTCFKVVWHHKNEDSVYFDSENPIIEHF